MNLTNITELRGKDLAVHSVESWVKGGERKVNE